MAYVYNHRSIKNFSLYFVSIITLLEHFSFTNSLFLNLFLECFKLLLLVFHTNLLVATYYHIHAAGFSAVSFLTFSSKSQSIFFFIPSLIQPHFFQGIFQAPTRDTSFVILNYWCSTYGGSWLLTRLVKYSFPCMHSCDSKYMVGISQCSM